MTVLPKGTSSTKAQRNLYIQEAGEEIRRKEDAHGRLVKFLREPIAESLYGSLHLKNQVSQERIILSEEALRRDFQHRHRVVHMQKQLDEASKESHEETVMLRREDDESSVFPKPMADWKTSNQYKEIHELEANNIAMKGSLNDTEKSSVCHTDLGSW